MSGQKIIAILACAGLVLMPLPAWAYIGPGAGLSLLGALWALVVAVATAVVFLFAWPIRRMRRRKREAMELEKLELEQQELAAVERERASGLWTTATSEASSTLQPPEKKTGTS